MKATASIREEKPADTAPRRSHRGNAHPVWAKYGLTPSHFLSARRADSHLSSLSRPARFTQALEELGGLFAIFGRFLAGRADLLASPYLQQLRKIRPSRSETGASGLLDRALNERISHLLPIGSTPYSKLYRGVCRETKVVAEIFWKTAAAFEEESWEDFCGGIRRLAGSQESAVTTDSVLEEFWRWLVLQADIERKRSILRNLQHIPAACVSRFPLLIAELQSDVALVYECLDGEHVDLESTGRDVAVQRTMQLATEALLEQPLFLSMVPADVDPGNLLLTRDGNIAFQTFPAMDSVPPEWNLELLQYTVSAVAGDTSQAVRMLSRIVGGGHTADAEQRLWQQLSALQPELKVHTVTPNSVATLENFWRSLRASGLTPPLFLQLFHRQLTVLGQHNGELAPVADLVSESLWPVLGRILRFRLAELASLERGREWLLGAGLLFFETARQMGHTLEQLRDNDLSLVVQTEEAHPQELRSNRRIASAAVCAILLAVLVSALHIAFRTPASALQLATGLVAFFVGVLLIVLVIRMD